MKRPRANQAGFSLVEVIVTLLIVATVLISFVAIRNNSVTEAIQAKWGQTAWTLAALQMGRLELDIETEQYDLPEGGSFEEEGYPQYQWEVQKNIEEFYVGQDPDDEEIISELFKLTLRVGYPDGEQTKWIEVTEYLRVPDEEDE